MTRRERGTRRTRRAKHASETTTASHLAHPPSESTRHTPMPSKRHGCVASPSPAVVGDGEAQPRDARLRRCPGLRREAPRDSRRRLEAAYNNSFPVKISVLGVCLVEGGIVSDSQKPIDSDILPATRIVYQRLG